MCIRDRLKGIGGTLKKAGGVAMKAMDPLGTGKGLLGRLGKAVGGVVSGIKDKMGGPKVEVMANLAPTSIPEIETRIAKLEFEVAKPPEAPEPPTSNVQSLVLPAQTKSSSAPGSGSKSAERSLPDFPVFKDTPQRRNNLELYGIVGVK